jgi:hypothetical protein
MVTKRGAGPLGGLVISGAVDSVAIAARIADAMTNVSIEWLSSVRRAVAGQVTPPGAINRDFPEYNQVSGSRQ